MADAATFSHKTNLFILGGAPIAVGRATGTYFTFSYNRPDLVQTSVGVDGLGYYFTHGDLSATMTVVVMPNSEDNDILMVAHRLYLDAPNGLLLPILVQQGLSVYTGVGAVMGQPPLEYSDTAVSRSWKVTSTRMLGVMGGAPTTPVLPSLTA